MGYPVKLQKVERPTNRSYYINLPTAVAESISATKGEIFEWSIENKNTLILSRKNKQPYRILKKS